MFDFRIFLGNLFKPFFFLVQFIKWYLQVEKKSYSAYDCCNFFYGWLFKIWNDSFYLGQVGDWTRHFNIDTNASFDDFILRNLRGNDLQFQFFPDVDQITEKPVKEWSPLQWMASWRPNIVAQWRLSNT